MNWRSEISSQVKAAAVAAALVSVPYLMLQQTPQTRISGAIEPEFVAAGDEIQVTWITTPQGSPCRGRIAREFIDSLGKIWPVTETLPLRFQDRLQRRSVRNGSTEMQTTVQVPIDAAPGRVTYRVTSRHWCNFVQEWTGWASTQVGPDLHFTIER